MSIKMEIDQAKDLTIITATKETSFEECLDQLIKFYDGDPTLKVLLKVNAKSVGDFNEVDIQRLATHPSRFKKIRSGAKTAIVAPDLASTASSLLFQMLGQSDELKIDVDTFLTEEEALNWLNGT